MIIQKFIQYGPYFINAVKSVAAGLGVMELGYPTVFSVGQLGPLTKFIGNEVIYKDQGMIYPICSYEDMIYESHRKATEEGILDGSRTFNDMPKRMFSFRSEIERNEFLEKFRISSREDLLSKAQINALIPKLSGLIVMIGMLYCFSDGIHFWQSLIIFSSFGILFYV